MRQTTPLRQLLLLFLVLSMLMAVVLFGAVSVAFEKLGLSPNSAFVLLFGSLFTSRTNLPLFTVRSKLPYGDLELFPLGAPHYTGKTLIAINVGGGLIPIAFSAYLVVHSALSWLEVASAVASITTISFLFSRPVPGIGVGMPIFVAPFGAALTALAVNPEQSAPLAYISGTLGVLIGADLLRIKDVKNLGLPVASIGGAGTFDGIFITGIVAVLLT